MTCRRKAGGVRTVGRKLVCLAAMGVCALVAQRASASDQWTKPTAEELSMKDDPAYPGVPAVILFREEVTKDDLHVMQHYERIKVLTEKGKEYGNVELRFASARGDAYYLGEDKSIGDIAGRTIHADGTIIPFTGKPYTKNIVKNSEYTYQARVFTLPDVEVGSIIEYRYATRIGDNVYEAPDFFLQDKLPARSVHFLWLPTRRELFSDDGMISNIAWFPILPPGVVVKNTETPAASAVGEGPQRSFEVVAKDIAPEPSEEYMPPIASYSYRVLFYYTPYHTPAEYWKARGKSWSKSVNSFADPNGALRAATQAAVGDASTPEAKLQKIYAKVMSLENTDYTRSHEKSEDKAAGLKKVSNAADVLAHERGDSTELTELFIGMARAAGLKAYAMLVPDRERRLFTPGWLTMNQFDNMIAIVNLNGKDEFFDPGSRYCEYGHLGWESSYVQGLRQTDDGTSFAGTPGEPYTNTKTVRVADLTADSGGELKGTLTLTYTGAVALEWRQRGLRGDEESMRHSLRTSIEGMLPKTMEVKVESIDNAQSYEKPLIVKVHVQGSAGTKTSKRWILPADIFTAEEASAFPHDKRDIPVYFHYAQTVQDAMRIKYPADMSVEAAPAETKVPFQKLGSYSLHAVTAPNSVTIQRNFLFNGIIIPSTDYASLRTFYSQMETKDKDSIILKAGAASASAPAAPGGSE